MFNLSQSLGLKTIFIRYNPDDFTAKGKKQNISKTKRHETLLKCLKTMTNKKYDEIDFVSVIYLYYDEYCETDCKLEKVEPAVPTITNTTIQPKNKIIDSNKSKLKGTITVKPKAKIKAKPQKFDL